MRFLILLALCHHFLSRSKSPPSLTGRRNRLTSSSASKNDGASGVIDKVENYIFDEPLILIGEDGANLHLRSTPLAFKATGKYWVNNHAHVLKPKHGNIDYLTNMLESLDYTHYITGAAQPKLTSEHLMNITVIIPPSLEQAQIANFLDDKTQQIDELIATEQQKIELLKKYRQSLISEVVTGKIDVRNEG